MHNVISHHDLVATESIDVQVHPDFAHVNIGGVMMYAKDLGIFEELFTRALTAIEKEKVTT